MLNKILKPCIYLVDDELCIRDSLTLLLESTGRAIKSFASARAFLDSYNADQPGCLILDMHMPIMNGFELQKELSTRAINIPILFISGHITDEDEVRANSIGAVAFLEKPFDNNTLLLRIEEAIKKDIAEKKQLRAKTFHPIHFKFQQPGSAGNMTAIRQ